MIKFISAHSLKILKSYIYQIAL